MAVFFLEPEESIVCVGARFELVLATQILGPMGDTPMTPDEPGGLLEPAQSFEWSQACETRPILLEPLSGNRRDGLFQRPIHGSRPRESVPAP